MDVNSNEFKQAWDACLQEEKETARREAREMAERRFARDIRRGNAFSVLKGFKPL